MIYDSLERLSYYTSQIPLLKEAIRILEDPSSDLSVGAHYVKDGIRYNVAEYSTLEGDKPYEVHRKEADVQIILEGEEWNAYALAGSEKKGEGYDEISDIEMVDAEESGRVRLSPGCFAIYFPSEPHKPGLAIDHSAEARKIIFKITI